MEINRTSPAWYASAWVSEALQPESYLEIGVREGDSLKIVLQHAKPARIYLCDTYGTGYGGSGRGSHDHIAALIKEIGYGGEVNYLDGDSTVLVPRLPLESMDLIMVDGDHSATGAMADLENCYRLLRVEGCIIFDGITHPDHSELDLVGRQFVRAHKDLELVFLDRFHDVYGGMVFRRRSVPCRGL